MNDRVYSQFNVFLVVGLSGTQNGVFQTNQIFQWSVKFKVWNLFIVVYGAYLSKEQEKKLEK